MSLYLNSQLYNPDSLFCYAEYYGNNSSAFVANTTNIIFLNKLIDSHNAWKSTYLICPFEGSFSISGCMLTSLGNTAPVMYINNIETGRCGSARASQNEILFSSSIIAKANDKISIRITGLSGNLTNNPIFHYISIAGFGL
jgi:hypothetical protein